MATEIELHPPLPDLARSATLRFLDGDGRRAATVDEAIAVAAEVDITDAAGRRERRVVAIADARAYLAEVDAFRTRVAATKARKAEETAVDADRVPIRRQLQAELVSTCPHDGERRRHAGRVLLLASPRPEGITVQAGIGFIAGAESYEEYRCPTCGSVELFRPGPLTHPAGPPDP